MTPMARTVFLLLLLLTLLAVPFPSLRAQSNAPETTADQRAKALALLNQKNYLDALPLLEDLAKQNPNDAQVLSDLAQCLIAKAALETDPAKAGQDRVRARDLLEKATALGDKSQRTLNLLDTLKGMPASGEIHFSDKAQVDAEMKDAEAAFAQNNYDLAIQKYMHVLELDPRNYYATLFVGDSYFSEQNYPKAGEWYDKAAEIDPNMETAYRYHADMLTKEKEFDKARTLSLEAIVADPFNPITWRALVGWANASHSQLVRVQVRVPVQIQPDSKGGTSVTIPPGASSGIMGVWFVYGGTRALWSKEKFKETFPQEASYRHSLAEEAEALTAAAKMAGEQAALHPDGDVAKDPDLQLLRKLYVANMIEPYVLLNAADKGIAQDYPAYREKNREKLEEYLATFVAPPPPVLQN